MSTENKWPEMIVIDPKWRSYWNYKWFNKSYANVETVLEVNGEYGVISIFKVKEKKKTEERKMKGMLSTLAETKKRKFGEQKQVYVKDVEDKCKFVYLENNMVSLIEEKIHFVPFQVLLNHINAENIVKLKLAYVGGLNFVC